MGTLYLTAQPTNLVFQAPPQPSNPSNSQLFTAYQNVDGTWAFQSLSNGKYLRALNNGFTIDYQTYIGSWERWYIERHGDHVHIQSAQFSHFYWSTSGNTLTQQSGGARNYMVEHWPKINWLWNWWFIQRFIAIYLSIQFNLIKLFINLNFTEIIINYWLS